MRVYAFGRHADRVQNASDTAYVQSAFTVFEKHVGTPSRVRRNEQGPF
jgi:hypothetical protein